MLHTLLLVSLAIAATSIFVWALIFAAGAWVIHGSEGNVERAEQGMRLLKASMVPLFPLALSVPLVGALILVRVLGV